MLTQNLNGSKARPRTSSCWHRPILPLFLAALLVLLLGALPAAAEGVPTVITDKAKYYPYETVIITGAGFEAGQVLDVVVTSPDGTVYTGDGDYTQGYDTITAGPDGSFVYHYRLNYYGEGVYTVEVFDSQADPAHTTVLASTSFYDPKPEVNIDQCANGAVGAPPEQCIDTAWVNGNLGASKAHYAEGQSVPYRATFINLDASSTETYSLTIEWDVTNADKHALDYLTTYTETEGNADACNDFLGATCLSSVDKMGIPIPDPSLTATHGFVGTQVPGEFALYGGTLLDVSTYMLDTNYPDGASKTTNGIVVSFEATQTEAVLAWGGHIASRIDWGIPNSAGDISGSPYHMRLIDFECTNPTNCSAGNQDRSLAADAIFVPADIIIVKDSVPNHAWDFKFTTNFTDTFWLDDDAGAAGADGVYDNTQTFRPVGPYDATTFTFTETATNGWSLDLIECDVSYGTADVDLFARSASIYNVSEAAVVTCIFTNTQQSQIIINKVTVPSGDPQSFAFTGDLGPFTLTHAAAPKESGWLEPGSYNITETLPVAGWDLTSATCSDGSDPTSIGLSAGETVTCTFTNTKRGKIIVDKVTVPSGDPQSFAFTGDLGPFTLTHAAAPKESGWLEPGSYNVTETLPVAGWDLTSATCSDGSDPTSIGLSAGETVTCTFTNTKRGEIIVDKVTVPSGDPQSFAFTGDLGPFTLTHAAAPKESGWLEPGSYNITETLPVAGWDLTSATCSDGSDPTSIGLSAGETVTCTFTNTKRGEIIVDKVTVPSGDPQSFAFTGDLGPFTLTHAAAPKESGWLEPGSYNVTETLPVAGWDLTSATCSDGSDPTSIGLSAGETVTCTFTNTKRGEIIVDKVTVPSGDPQSFAFTGDLGPFTLTHAAAPKESGWLEPGSYNVTETLPVAGWDLTSAICSDGSDPTSIGLSAGETVTCTFTNTKRGKIIVDKVTVPSGDPQSFAFTGDLGPFTLTHAAAPKESGWLEPGSYNVTETLPVAGWDLTSATCSDGSDPTSIGLSAGETVTCTFTNTKRGKIIVDKVTVPSGDPQSFAFTGDLGPFTLTHAAAPKESGWLEPGSYNVTETLPVAGWDLTSATCSDGSDPTSIGLSAGETVTCTFTNTKRGEIIVDKVTVPSGDPQSFAFTGDLGPFTLTHAAAPKESGWLEPGSYNITETLPVAGWDLTSATCSDGSDPTSIGLSAGETVTCTFTNTKRGKIIVDKVTVPSGDPQSFAFTGDLGPFTLTHAAAPKESGWLEPGSYNITETLPVAGWDLTSATCSDGSDPTSIGLSAGETVTCTFTNTKRGEIIVDKVTVPSGDPQSFAFTGDLGPFTLTHAAAPKESGWLEPGSYNITETLPVAGWDLTSATCSDGSDPTSIGLSAGETVTCTFTNTKRGKIIVEKETDPAGSTQSFEFPSSYAANFFLKDGEDDDSGWLVPGTYTVTEIVPTGWDLTDTTCDDGSPASAIALDPGETVTCTFTNTQRGKIIVEKETDPAGSTQSFEFPSSYAANFFLKDGEDDDSGWLAPGTYTVTEIVPTGWDLTSATCSDESDPTAIYLAAGETVTCTFTNTQRGKIIVEKETDPAGSTQSFEFSSSYAANFFLKDGEDDDSGWLVPGTYTVTEIVPAGWDLTSATCSDQSDPAAIGLAAGETVTCTFTNTQRGSITIIKDALPPDGTDFQFGFGVVGPGPADSFTLDDAVPPDIDAFGDTEVFANLLPGQYGVSETVPLNWSLTGIRCVGSESITTTLVGAVIDLGPGENVTCTFTNAYVDARIAIVGTATNEAGADHTFTVTVEKNEGDVWSPAKGVTVTITFPGGAPGTVDATDCEVYGTDADGVCLVTINSKVAGVFNAHAKASIPVREYILERETDGQGGNSEDAVKTYVDAWISIGDSAVNDVGDLHTFTVTIKKHDGSVWSPAVGVAPTITFPGVQPGSYDLSKCEAGTLADGTCLVTVDSDVAGVFSVHAAADIPVGGLTLTRQTDGQGDNSEDAVKTYVDAAISIGDSAVNQVGDPHTFTIKVTKNDGTALAPAAGVKPVITFLGDSPDVLADTCADPGTDAAGLCQITINSNVSGVFTAHAAADILVGGLTLFRETDGLGDNSGDATKTYFGPNVSIIKTAGDAADGEVFNIRFYPDPVLVAFHYLVTNTGDTYLSDLIITDDRGTPADTGDDETLTKADCVALAGPLAPDASINCTAEFLVAGEETNIAVVIGNPTDKNGVDLPGMDDPTDDDDAIVDMEVGPQVAIDKRLVDMDIDAEWPNYVTFTIAIENVGPSTIDILPLEDDYDPWYLSFVSADPMPEEFLDDGLVTWYDLTAAGSNGFGVNLAHGEVFTLTTVFMVVHDITSTTNLAIVSEAIDVYGNTAPDVEDEETIIAVPTAVELLTFSAAPAGDMILLEWETAMEVDNWGFNLYRGLTPDLGSAEWIHFEPGMGWGQFDGRQYQYLDPHAGRGQTVYYWLEDVDLSDRTHLLSGPVMTTLLAQHRIFLPIVLR